MSERAKCCICLDEFTRPVSLPCGHCFCLGCIGEFWRVHRVCQCPLCMASFPTRPQLQIYQARHREDAAVPLRAGEVPCDFCPAKHRAVKSCVECLASYCDSHLEPHYQDAALGRHRLIDVSKNLEDAVCRLHGRQLDRFCRSDQTCICAMCVQTDHRGHHVISIAKEAAKKKVSLKRKTTKLQQMIEERLSRLEHVRLLGGGNEKEVKGQNEEVKRQNEEVKRQNEEVISRLEEEISELQRRSKELEQLSETEDDIHFVQVWVTAQSQPDNHHSLI